jgi:hypothetical protein
MIVVLESFNLTNVGTDNLVLKHNVYKYNLTVTLQYYVWGLMQLNDLQFTLILYNKAYMWDTY